MLKETRVDFDAVTGRVSNPPRQVFLELTGKCNLACVHCSKDYGLPEAENEPDMSRAVVARVGPWIERALFVNLNLVGEPMMAPLFADVVRQAHRGPAEVSFNTNATLMSEEQARFLVEQQVNSVAVSFEGIDFHRRVRGVPFRSTLERLEILDREKKKAGTDLPHVAIAYTLFRDNLLELVPMLEEILPRIQVHAVHVQPLIVFYETVKSQNVYDAERVDSVINGARESCRRHDTELILFRSQFVEDERSHERARRLQRELGPFSDTLGCTDPFFEVKVRADGGLLSCSNGIEPPFNVLHHELDEIWNSEFYCNLRRNLYRRRFLDKCRQCPYMFGSFENNLSPLRPGVHHQKAERFLGYPVADIGE